MDDPDMPILTFASDFSIVHQQSYTAIDEGSWHMHAWLMKEGPDGAVVEENGDVI